MSQMYEGTWGRIVTQPEQELVLESIDRSFSTLISGDYVPFLEAGMVDDVIGEVEATDSEVTRGLISGLGIKPVLRDWFRGDKLIGG